MGIFDQLRAAQDMMKGMSPEEQKALMEQAKEAQKMMKEDPEKFKQMQEQAKAAEKMMKIMIEKEVNLRIKELGLVTREEVRKMIGSSK